MNAASERMRPGDGRAALVTGAGKRLGRAIALALAEDGYAVGVHYNGSRDGAEAVVAEIEAAGGRGVALQRDLSTIETAGGLVDEAVAALGPLALLVNSASLFDGDALADLSLESWRALTDVNLGAPVMLMQAFARAHATADAPPENASVVNMLDVQLDAPSPKFFSYFCGKAGLEIATRMAALELAPRIRVNGIAPGLVLRSGAQTDAEFEARQAMTPLGVGLGAADIVQAVRYLAQARHVTGHVLAVDSGQHMLGFGNARMSAGGE